MKGNAVYDILLSGYIQSEEGLNENAHTDKITDNSVGVCDENLHDCNRKVKNDVMNDTRYIDELDDEVAKGTNAVNVWSTEFHIDECMESPFVSMYGENVAMLVQVFLTALMLVLLVSRDQLVRPPEYVFQC